MLHNRGRVDPETAARVLKVARGNGYHPAITTQQLALMHQKLKIGFISRFDYNGFWSIVNKNAVAMAKQLAEFNITVEFRHLDYCLPEIQLPLIDELDELGIDALIIVPMESEQVSARLKRLSDKGIPVILINSELMDFEPFCYIGSDYYVGGKTAAGLLHHFSHSEKLSILLMNGSKYLSSQVLRKRGFIDELSTLNPNCELIESPDITNDPEYAFRIARDLLCQYPQVNAVYTVPDNAAAVGNAIRACDRIGSTVHIGFSMTDATRPCILDGSISALIGQRAQDQGTKPFEILLNYFASGEEPALKRYLMLNDIFIQQNCVF